ncbi:Potassium channel subfamily K member [Apodemus speciosus]|uniref:Potassium channel subfamily K member n=1 Tax=Apodemus speciosus TaxID=105296 RepID=A0ABQ0FS44_APOSI
MSSSAQPSCHVLPQKLGVLWLTSLHSHSLVIPATYPRSTSLQPRPLQPLPGATGGLACSLTFPDSECRAMGRLKPWARYLLLLVAHLLAMGLGAVVLQALEGPPALHLQAQLQAELAAFQAEHRACLPPEALEELLGAVLRARAHGVSSLGNDSETSSWDLPSALLFTASILTTTGSSRQSYGSIRPDITSGNASGYGHMAPLSSGGKAFCVAYAALGLPASLALVAALRHCLLPVFSCPGAWVAVRWQPAPAQAALLRAAGLGLLVACVFVLLPALVLWGVQGDCSLLDAVYFCFGSLSTIGLGDLLPAHGRGLHPALYHLGQFALLGYLLLGLLAMLLAVETFSELPQVRAMVKFFGPSGSRTDEDQNGILGQDELALSTMPPDTPVLEQTIPASAPEQTPAC